ncbi:MAG TPA: DUF4350 domain-containing protein [Gemmatimonadaceae bacterium]|nr:DUF4350 domain-containing protein [Gemmatimonadaceae bacterium]
MANRGLDRWLRPTIVLPVLGILLLAAVVFSPNSGYGNALDMRLTTFGANPFGAKATHDVLARLGWTVEQRRVAFRAPLDTSATYLVLDPPLEPSATEVSVLLDAVRRGATVIASPEAGSPLADSLRVRRSRYDEHAEVVRDDSEATSTGITPLTSAAIDANEFGHVLMPVPTSEEDTAPKFPPSTKTLILVRTTGGKFEPAVATRQLGKGTAVLVSDFEFLRNNTVRDTSGMILAVRLLERVGSDRSRRLVFDEYHQGFGDTATLGGVVWHALFGTPVGRAAAQALAACLILMLAVGIRPIRPHERLSIERRSPLEHVGALTLAYEQIHATRLATGRLVRGLRRRHPLGAGSLSDDAYLVMLTQRLPRTMSDVALVQRALSQPMPAADWVGVGGAIDHIERAITP